MSKATKSQVAATVAAIAAKQPTVVANEVAALDYAYDLTIGRSRPVVAINEDGELVVCCKSTAKKHGWTLQGKLYARVRSGKALTVKADAAPAPEAKITMSLKTGKLSVKKAAAKSAAIAEKVELATIAKNTSKDDFADLL